MIGLSTGFTSGHAESPRILVGIASFGPHNDSYLERVLSEYRSMPWPVRLVVFSNIPKDLGPDVEVRVGLPDRNPWSLPFAHKLLFAEEVDNYDVFIYSEDDMLMTAVNISAFIEYTNVLPPGQISGLIRFEEGPSGAIQYCDIHAGAYWDTQSVQTAGQHTFAYLSNEHSACYLLTQEQLRHALQSGNYLLAPHQGRYDMLVTAATDPYTRCGFRKMICISELERSSIHHLPNKYFHRFGLPKSDLQAQLTALLQSSEHPGTCPPLIQMAPRLQGTAYVRDHYHPPRAEVMALISEGIRSVLSFGCGDTEIALAQRGIRVVAIPVDSVVSTGADKRGVQLLCGGWEAAIAQLEGQSFDCLLLLDVLHLVRNPTGVLGSLMEFIKPGGIAIVLSPHIGGLRFIWRLLRWREGRRAYRAAGINITTSRLIRKWLSQAGAIREKLIDVAPCQTSGPVNLRQRLFSSLVPGEFIIQARRRAGEKFVG